MKRAITLAFRGSFVQLVYQKKLRRRDIRFPPPEHFLSNLEKYTSFFSQRIFCFSWNLRAHFSHIEPGLCSYEMAALKARRLGMPSSDIEQFYRRMIFTVLAVNQDDHVKNISYLMDRSGI